MTVMKKLGAVLCVLLVALSLSACRAFHDDRTQPYTIDEPYEATVFLQLKNSTDTDTSATEKWQAWQGAMNTVIAEMASSDEPKITAFNHRETAEDGTITVDLTLENVPPHTVHTVVRPFKIYYTQILFNPITLLPASDAFTYLTGIATPRRHTSVNADVMLTHNDGTYVYLWSGATTPEIYDVYPNRPLYYVLVLAGAVVVGIVVYIVARTRSKQPAPTAQF